jgi:hypothetical protein
MSVEIIKAGFSQDTLSVEQEFDLQVLVENDGTAETVGNGRIYIENFHENTSIEYVSGSEEDTLNFTVGTAVNWRLRVNQFPLASVEVAEEVGVLLSELAQYSRSADDQLVPLKADRNKARELFSEIANLIGSSDASNTDLTVRMAQIPVDENTDDAAFTADSIIVKSLVIQHKAAVSISMVEAPDTLSTGQVFRITVNP